MQVAARLPNSAIMTRTRALCALAIVAVISNAAPAWAATCLDAEIMSSGGMAVTSPFGVDRTGRASKGWHMGLDIVNGQGKGSPIYSGSTGKAQYRYQASGAGHYMTIDSGDMRYLYMHLQNADQRLSGKQVSAGDRLGQMGCSGMRNCAPHLHLSAQIKGDSLSSSGAQGRAFNSMSKSLSNRPLTADGIKAALPNSWYVVNPEPFLPHPIPFRESTKGYGPQMGGWRSMTLPRTCSPDPSVVPNARVASTTDTGSSSAGLDSQASMRSGGEGYAGAAADQEMHGLTVELAKLSAAEAAQSSQAARFLVEANNESALAHLLLIASDK